MIDAYTSMPHYADHLFAILDAVPEELRGTMYVPSNHRREFDRPVTLGHAPNSVHPLLVGGYQDLVYARRPKVLVAHGAQQRYIGAEDHPSYNGGAGREHADLFLYPREECCALERSRYPRARCAVVGCPKLDSWVQVPKPNNEPPVIAVTFHWDCHIGVPEAGWAWPTWRDTIEQLAKITPVLGHSHPRARQQLEPWWHAIGVEYVRRPEELLARADVLVLDNSSLGMEWAACDRPTVWLSDIGWNQSAEGAHGLRFGEELPGMHLRGDEANIDRLVHMIEAARDPRMRYARERVTNRVYGGPPGNMAARAAQAVLDLIDDPAGAQTYKESRPCTTC